MRFLIITFYYANETYIIKNLNVSDWKKKMKRKGPKNQNKNFDTGSCFEAIKSIDIQSICCVNWDIIWVSCHKSTNNYLKNTCNIEDESLRREDRGTKVHFRVYITNQRSKFTDFLWFFFFQNSGFCRIKTLLNKKFTESKICWIRNSLKKTFTESKVC